MIGHREIELKLELNSSPSVRARRVRRHLPRLPGLDGDAPSRRLVSAIFDTDDHALQRRGLVLRIRRDGERRIQTLKSDIAGGILERGEWESEVAGDEPDLAAIADPALREEVAAAGPLVPVLQTEFDRTLWHFRHHGSDVELSLDEGTIRAGGRTAPISEIEIELKSGAATALFGVAREILGSVPARLGLQSKSERGYGLLNPSEERKAEPFRVTRKMTVATAFQSIVRTCLRHYHLNEPGIFTRDAEALHRSRVAIRRLRSCLKLHKALVADAEGERLKKGLRALSQALGTARNLDVYLDRIEAEGAAAAVALRARISAERELAYDRLTGKLRSKRLRLLLLDLMAYVETGEWLRDPARRELRATRVRPFAEKTLAKRWARLRKAGRDLAEQAPEARHQIRIDGKVLRYAADFYAGAFTGKTARKRRGRLLDALADLQAHLGDLNDLETAATLDLGVEDGAPPDPDREAGLLASAQKAHERIRKAEPFWA